MDIAANSETRNWFYNALVKMGRSEIYPEEYRNQKSFAESNMVEWLVYPTELGRMPDEIELMNVFKRSIIFSGSDAKAANTGRKKDGWREWPGLSTKEIPRPH